MLDVFSSNLTQFWNFWKFLISYGNINTIWNSLAKKFEIIWNYQDRFETVWKLLKLSSNIWAALRLWRKFWNYLEMSRQFWNRLGSLRSSGNIRTVSKRSGNFWNSLAIFGQPRDCEESFEIVRKRSGQFWDYLETSEHFWKTVRKDHVEISEQFETVWKVFRQSKHIKCRPDNPKRIPI